MRSLVIPLVVAALCVTARAVTVDQLLGGGRLVVYAERSHPDGRPSPARLAADARLLRHVGFRAVTTLAVTRGSAPTCRFFKRAGFRTVLVGVADPADTRELRRAMHLRRCADGYVVGDGGIAAGRYERDAAVRAVQYLRQQSGRPVTIREPIDLLEQRPELLRLGDWVFPTLDPFALGAPIPQDACGLVSARYRTLAARVPGGLPTVVAATGLPTSGDPRTSEYYQRAFFACIDSRQVPFGHFVAFDQPDRHDVPTGGHWGLFRADGTPKVWASRELGVTLAATRAAAGVTGTVPAAVRALVRVVGYVQREQWERLPLPAIDDTGAWQIPVTAERPVVVFAVIASWEAPSRVERLPVIDRAHVLARRDVPPL